MECYNPLLIKSALDLVDMTSKKLTAVFFLTAIFFSLAGAYPVLSAGGEVPTVTPSAANCVPVYGGGVQCPKVGQVLINKTVRNSSTGVFVDNLGPSDPKFRPESFVTFRFTVQNTGDETLSKVTVSDTLPDFIDFSSGPGNFNSNTKTLTFDVLDIAGGTSKTFEIVGRTVHVAALPGDKNIVCVVNNVTAVSSSQTDTDSSQVCIEKEMIVPQVPSAGPKDWMLTFAGIGTAATLGLFLRKKTVLS